MKFSLSSFVLSAAVVSLAGMGAAQAAPDADAAQALMKDNGCTKCHAVDKTKKGPSFKKIAEKYKGKADGADSVVKAITTGPTVKLADGSEEKHKVVESKDPKQVKNLADWILSN